MHVSVTIPLVLVIGVLAYACYQYMGLKLWHLLVCLLLGFLLAATSAAPQIQALLDSLLHGAHK
jgi:hypothetical protein